MSKDTYKIKSEVWIYPGMSAWHFVYIPKKQGIDIKSRFGANSKGWGSIPVIVAKGKSTWKTSIFPDKKSGSYILPIKAEIRRKEGIYNGDIINFTISCII